MVMLNTKLPMKWVMKYSKKPVFQMTPGTLAYYKWAQKIGRKEFLKRSQEKTKRFEEKNKYDLNFRVFKHHYLRDKNITEELSKEFKTLIRKRKGQKGITKIKHLSPEKILQMLKK